MKITFLGTGTSQGVPVIACSCEICRSIDYRDSRLRSSIHIEVDGQSLVIDTGPDFRNQMLRERIKHVDAILFTHEHKDHTAGMDDVRSFNFAQKIDMPIYAHQRVLDQLTKEFSYVFTKDKYPGVPRVDVRPIKNKVFSVNGIDVLPIEVMHYKLPVFGFRIQDFTYITDANFISETEIKKIMGTKILVLNALQKSDHMSHFTLDQAIEMANIIKPEKCYFTHISHKLGKHRDVEKELPKNCELAFDGLKIHI